MGARMETNNGKCYAIVDELVLRALHLGTRTAQQRYLMDVAVAEAKALADKVDDGLRVAESAMRDALSDFEWAERAVPGTNFQASILKLRYALDISEANT